MATGITERHYWLLFYGPATVIVVYARDGWFTDDETRDHHQYAIPGRCHINITAMRHGALLTAQYADVTPMTTLFYFATLHNIDGEIVACHRLLRH